MYINPQKSLSITHWKAKRIIAILLLAFILSSPTYAVETTSAKVAETSALDLQKLSQQLDETKALNDDEKAPLITQLNQVQEWLAASQNNQQTLSSLQAKIGRAHV